MQRASTWYVALRGHLVSLFAVCVSVLMGPGRVLLSYMSDMLLDLSDLLQVRLT